jgi:hypothetical protein
VLWELTRDNSLNTRKQQNLPEVSLSISSWFPVVFERFTIHIRVLGIISSATRVGAADCDFARPCQHDRFLVTIGII